MKAGCIHPGHCPELSDLGAELSYTRAAQAAKVMDKVHSTAWEACTLAEESVNLLFLNPPYDFDRVEHQGRLEQSFLKSSYAKLVRGGLLVYIVRRRFARWLMG